MSTLLRGTIRYDGTGFAGWQRQPNRRTVQGELEQALAQIASQPVPVQGAGRTDAGVHALGQVFSCTWPGDFPPRLRHALSKMLGPEIRVLELEEAPPEFNARFSAHSKRYRYTMDLAKEPDPFTARYAWHVPHPVDLELLASLLPLLEGRHDFAGFQSANAQMESTIRTVYSITLGQGGLLTPADRHNLIHLEFHGDGFLYRMVRNITGTLVEIARGRFPAEFLQEQLENGGPFKGHCAPAHGLALVQVYYSKQCS